MGVDKQRLGVRALLHWTFGRECASIDMPPRPDEEQGTGFGMEYVLIQRAKLGGIKIDTSVGTSSPHEDAEAVAAIVSGLLPQFGGLRMALTIAELARADRLPDCYAGERPRLGPKVWGENQHGRFGQAVVLREYEQVFEQPHPRHPQHMIRRRRSVKEEWVPCIWQPSLESIESARRDYERWWRAIDEIRENLRVARVLRCYEVTDAMPPRKPWVQA